MVRFFPFSIFPLLISLTTGRRTLSTRWQQSDPGEQLRPLPPVDADPTDWGAFKSKEGFRITELVYQRAQMSQGNIDDLLKIWLDGQLPFSNQRELYAAIDNLTVGGVPWKRFSVQYDGAHSGNRGDVPQPKWMSDVHEVFFRDPQLVIHEILANPEFKDGIDFIPYRVFDKDGVRMYQHLMGGNWAWEQAVCLLTSPSYWLNVLAHTSLNVGCDSSGSKDAWGNIYSRYSGKRQDSGVSSDRPYRSISAVLVNWEPP